MDALKVTKTALAMAIVLGLSACSSEDTPNSAPAISIEAPGGESFQVLEASEIEIPFSITDVDGLGDIASVSVVEKEVKLRGRVSINMENNTLVYASPYLVSEKDYTESFDVLVKDSSGAESVTTVVVQTNDLNSPATVIVSPPTQATGFSKSRKDTLINFMHPESQMVTISFKVSDDEADADDFIYDYQLKKEGVIFNTDVVVEAIAGGATISFKAPDIVTPYETVQFEFSVNDGDDTVVATANATIVNDVKLSWSSKSDTNLSENNGGKLLFDSSEGYDYSADYEVLVTNQDGTALTYDYPYSFDQSTGTITFTGSQSGFQGNQSLLVTVNVSNDIVIDSGELFVETSTLQKTVTITEDRDDLFLGMKDKFFSDVQLLEDIKTRNDEVRVSSTFSSYAFLSRFVNKQKAEEMEQSVVASLTANYNELTSQADVISTRINDGDEGAETSELITAFGNDLSSVGKDARKLISEQQDLVEELSGEVLALGKVSTGGASFSFDGKLTHFVGNSLYGFFKDEEKTDWEFKPEYKYLASVDISDPFCFN